MKNCNNINIRVFLIFFCLTTLILPVECHSAGETLLDSWDYSFRLEGGIFYQDMKSWPDIEIEMPDYSRERKIYSELAYRHSVLREDLLTDNPLVHGASFNELIFKARNRGFGIEGRVLMEDRGMSYGVFDTHNSIIFPKVGVSADSSFSISGEKIEFGIYSGYFEDITLGNGLTIYNIDTQGNRFYLKWQNLRMGLTTIGDLSRTYDLNIGDVHYYSLGLEEFSLFDLVELSAETGYHKLYRGLLDEKIDGKISFALELKRGNSFRFYSETGFREYSRAYFDRIDQSANITGINYHAEKSRFVINVTAERRYYGRHFNEGFRSEDQDFNFRKNGISINHNTIGTDLYPISYYMRPFSQWAVYTEYQHRDVSSYILRGRCRYNLTTGLFLECFFDLNYMDVSSEDPFLYPFYDFALGWVPLESTSFSIGLTNRAMNLDEQYPTLYLLKSPALEINWFYRVAF
ncbi:MAG: hypothetical protein ACQERI_05940 [Candidatus Krumholzibacteriota bacterium]